MIRDQLPDLRRTLGGTPRSTLFLADLEFAFRGGFLKPKQPLVLGKQPMPHLVEPLARVALNFAHADDVVEILRQIQQRELALCYSPLRSHVIAPGQGSDETRNPILHTLQERHSHASQRGRLSEEYHLNTNRSAETQPQFPPPT